LKDVVYAEGKDLYCQECGAPIFIIEAIKNGYVLSAMRIFDSVDEVWIEILCDDCFESVKHGECADNGETEY